MSKLANKLKEEFFALLPPTIFFFVALHIVAFVRVLMLKGTGISPLTSMSIAVAALILGKAVLIADMLPPINTRTNVTICRATKKRSSVGATQRTPP